MFYILLPELNPLLTGDVWWIKDENKKGMNTKIDGRSNELIPQIRSIKNRPFIKVHYFLCFQKKT